MQAAPQTSANEEKIAPRAGEMAALPEDLSWVRVPISESSLTITCNSNSRENYTLFGLCKYLHFVHAYARVHARTTHTHT